MDDSSNELLTQFHVLEQIRQNGEQTLDQISQSLNRHTFKVWNKLMALRSRGFIIRRRLPVEKKLRYYYRLTTKAEHWRIRQNMNSYLDSNNPQMKRFRRIEKRHSEPIRMQVGKHIRVVPEKRLAGFR